MGVYKTITRYYHSNKPERAVQKPLGVLQMHVALINQENMGRLNRLQYRVETPYKNGHLDHLFEDYQKAIKFCDKAAAEFGIAQLFNHLTNKVIHFSVHETQYEANKANADFRDLEYEPNWTYNVLNRVGDK